MKAVVLRVCGRVWNVGIVSIVVQITRGGGIFFQRNSFEIPPYSRHALSFLFFPCLACSGLRWHCTFSYTSIHSAFLIGDLIFISSSYTFACIVLLN